MNSADDEKLDALLRDVSVPPGLKQRLRRIPNEPVVGVPNSGWAIGQRMVMLAMAAGLAGIVVWLAWPPATEIRNPVAVVTETTPVPENPVPNNRVDELAMEIELLTSRIVFRERESRLRDRERSAPVQSLSAQETESLVLCLSDQSAIAWGAEPESVRADMQRIIDLYPNTAGAKKANEFLASTTDQNSMKP